MESLYEDLEAPLYFWFNRREPKTQWEKALSPMGHSIGNMSVLRWYGVQVDKNEKCPVCGKYFQNAERADMELFAGNIEAQKGEKNESM